MKRTVIWADLDANRHMRNTAYSEYATQARISFFMDHGYSMEKLAEEGLGPILLKESLVFYREVLLGEALEVSVYLKGETKDADRFVIFQEIKKANGKLAATVQIHGAWMNLKSRKIEIPPSDLIQQVLVKMPRTKDYSLLDKRDFYF